MCKKVGLTVIMVSFAVAAIARAGVPQPSVALYGTITIDEIPITAADDVAVIARVSGVAEPVGTYTMGADPEAGDQYVLQIRMEALADGATQSDNAAVIGQSVRILVTQNGGPEMYVDTYEITDCGQLVNLNLEPTSCPVSSPALPELVGLELSTKNRFLSFTAGDPTLTQAVRVTFVSLPPPFDLWDGAELWVGPTSQVSEAGANVTHTEGFPDFTAATLRCAPHYTDFSGLGLVHVFHEGIVPGGSYRVEVIYETCDTGSAEDYSDPLAMNTPVWGDTVRDLSGTPPLPPGGPPVGIDDVLAILERFSNADGAITKARADLEPACLDLRINVTDVLSSIAGFSGLSYPFAPTAAGACDSTCTNVLP